MCSSFLQSLNTPQVMAMPMRMMKAMIMMIMPGPSPPVPSERASTVWTCAPGSDDGVWKSGDPGKEVGGSPTGGESW